MTLDAHTRLRTLRDAIRGTRAEIEEHLLFIPQHLQYDDDYGRRCLRIRLPAYRKALRRLWKFEEELKEYEQ